MESWKNGRRDLFDQLTKACNRIGEGVAAELDDENMVRIGREELRLLRENSRQVEKLVEHNARLADELETCREASSRIEDLERENQRLVAELAQKLKQHQQGLGTPKTRLQFGASSKSTPGPSELPSSATRTEANDPKTVTREKYQSLVAKYNNMCEKYTDLKDVKQKILDLLANEREKIKNWGLYAKEQDKIIDQKNDKIQRLQEEIRRLCSPSKGQRESSIALLESENQAKENPLPRPLLLEHGSDVEAPLSSPIKSLPPKLPIEKNGMSGKAPQGLADSAHQVADVSEHVDPAHPDPVNVLVEDTEYEQIEPHSTASTEGSSYLFLPSSTSFHEEMAEVDLMRDSTSPECESISCRNVKKRKLRHDSPHQKIKSEIKVETIGSSPIGLAAFSIFSANDSLDLDDIGEKIDTPRKQRKLLELSRQAPRSTSCSPRSERIPTCTQGHSSPTKSENPGHSSQETPIRRRKPVLQPRSTNGQILPRTSDDRAPKKRRVVSDEAVGELLEDGEIVTAAKNLRRQTSATIARLEILLAKPSPPKQILSPALLPRNAGQFFRRPRAFMTSNLAPELRYIPQEDAESRKLSKSDAVPRESPLPPSRGLSRNSIETSRPSSKGSSSSGTLRGSGEPSRPTSKDTSRVSAESSRPTPKGTPRRSMEPPECSSISNETSCLSPRRLPIASTCFAEKFPKAISETPRPSFRQATEPSRTFAFKPRRSPLDSNIGDREMDPAEERLRLRPIDKLNLNDFKVNPNYNQGYDYAFKEVVRDQKARKCLQGCTKPDCCGHKFRALVEINRNTGKQPTFSQEEANEMLLDEFLGDNAYKLRNMSKSQKEELLIQAKTREMANKYGRHRHAYERKSSPPGFWRSEFPTTQQEMEDREKAKEKARHDVAKRYKEAMRPGGAFLFRDE